MRVGVPKETAEGEPTADVVRTLSPAGAALSIIGARQHNLRNIDVHLPLGAMIAVERGTAGASLRHRRLAVEQVSRLRRRLAALPLSWPAAAIPPAWRPAPSSPSGSLNR